MTRQQFTAMGEILGQEDLHKFLRGTYMVNWAKLDLRRLSSSPVLSWNLSLEGHEYWEKRLPHISGKIKAKLQGEQDESIPKGQGVEIGFTATLTPNSEGGIASGTGSMYDIIDTNPRRD